MQETWWVTFKNSYPIHGMTIFGGEHADPEQIKRTALDEVRDKHPDAKIEQCVYKPYQGGLSSASRKKKCSKCGTELDAKGHCPKCDKRKMNA